MGLCPGASGARGAVIHDKWIVLLSKNLKLLQLGADRECVYFSDVESCLSWKIINGLMIVLSAKIYSIVVIYSWHLSYAEILLQSQASIKMQTASVNSICFIYIIYIHLSNVILMENFLYCI